MMHGLVVFVFYLMVVLFSEVARGPSVSNNLNSSRFLHCFIVIIKHFFLAVLQFTGELF